MNLEAINKELERLCDLHNEDSEWNCYISLDNDMDLALDGYCDLKTLLQIAEILKRYKKDLINNN